jgi:predicted nucleic acid-binding protein
LPEAELAVAAVRSVLADPLVQTLPQTTSGFHEALRLYDSRPDKEYSLIDCRSMAAMRSLGLTEVLSNDRHFGQEGFAVVFP